MPDITVGQIEHVHNELARIIETFDDEILKNTLGTDEWSVLETIGHVNAWGIELLSEIRYMVQNPGKPFSYTIDNYHAWSEAELQKRINWPVGQYAGENRRVGSDLAAFIKSLGGSWPDSRISLPFPWPPDSFDIAGVLEMHYDHAKEHIDSILQALEKSRPCHGGDSEARDLMLPDE